MNPQELRLDGFPRMTTYPSELCECGHAESHHHWTCGECGHVAPYVARLDAAWAAVEALLPDGWRITRVDLDDAGVGTGWRAIASIDDMTIVWYQRFRRGRGDTLVAALVDLTSTLSKSPPS